MRSTKVIALIWACAACATARPTPDFTPLAATTHLVHGGRDGHGTVVIRSLGVAGFAISRDSSVLVTAPSITNASLGASFWSALPFTRPFVPTLRPDTALVASALGSTLRRAGLILVGHGHFDHALDVAFIARSLAPNAQIVASRSAALAIAAPADSDVARRMVTVADLSDGAPETAGSWVWSRDSAFRVLPLRSGHAPTLRVGPFRYLFASGSTSASMSPPRTAADWRAGTPLAFLIDVMDADRRDVTFRVYFQDAPAEPAIGMPSRAVLSEHPVDVAILCVATAAHVRSYPDSAVQWLRPGTVIGSHWENFFRPWGAPPRLNFFTDTTGFRREVRRASSGAAEVFFPRPGETIVFGPP